MTKQTIYQIVEKGEHGHQWHKVFDYFIVSLILLSLISIILESVEQINEQYGLLLSLFNNITIVVFSLEYFARIYISDLTHPSNSRFHSALKFICSPFGIIDLLAILPFYLPMFIPIDLRFSRTLRIMRFLRVLKLNRYNSSLSLIWTVIKEKKNELLMTGFITFVVLLMASFLMYAIEGQQQPEAFPNIFAAFWWAVATLTTIGYGDIYPITALGKLISGVIAVLGIGLVALPTGLISVGFMTKVEEKHKKEDTCPHCGK